MRAKRRGRERFIRGERGEEK
jgi:hypothetical protein